MHTKNTSTFGWLRQRASALLPILALAVMWTAILVAMRAEAHSLQTAAQAGREMAGTSERVVPVQSVSPSADLSPESDSDFRADRAYFRALARNAASDYRADRAYFRSLGIEMSTVGTSAPSTTDSNISR